MNKKRTKQVVLRLSEIEFAILQDKVKESGQSQQEYLRKAALKKKIQNNQVIKDLYIELQRQGNNINQIAKKLNSSSFVDYRELKIMMEEWRNTWQSLKQYLLTQV